MGLSITTDYQIVAQNRSHYVNSQTHKQFSPLEAWIQAHRSELFEVRIDLIPNFFEGGFGFFVDIVTT